MAADSCRPCESGGRTNAFGCCGCRYKMAGSCSNVLDIFFDDSCPLWVGLPFWYTQQPTPYHPNSNGIVERAVRTVKTRTLLCRLERFLFTYRRTPSTSTSISPAMAMFVHFAVALISLKSTLPIILQIIPKPRKVTLFGPGIFRGPKWIAGTVTETSGNAMMKVLTSQGKVARHMDQVRIRISRQISLPIDSDSSFTPAIPVFDTPMVGNKNDMQRSSLSQPSSSPDVPSVYTPCEEQSTSFPNRPPIHIHSDDEQHNPAARAEMLLARRSTRVCRERRERNHAHR
ncbi:hypothetical protein P5V15_015322 [Pogonomyrmex californicus]